MSDINTTSILDLPTDPANGGSIGGNVSLVTNETIENTSFTPPSFQNNTNTSNSNGTMSLDQTTISQIVNGLQQASIAGATSLPSRDLPLSTEQLSRDPYVQPNYIPTPSIEKQDYIVEMEDDDIKNYQKTERLENSLDVFYDEIQTPLLLAILYFLFQLPIFKQLLYKYLPVLFHKDGNYNISGLLVSCFLFAFVYYLLSKTVKQFSKF